MAVEALSRGAARALLVDRDRHAVEACRANLATTGFAGVARVRAGSAAGVLRGGPPREAPFDLVLLDPPYGLEPAESARVFEILRGPGWLSPAGRVVWERAARAAGGEAPIGWLVRWERAYGDTVVQILTCGDAAP
jgi:16S rRNA (guanine966-N2)-methyltransferase